MTGVRGTRQPPLRADARENREHLVAAARVAFAEQGADASLIDIARRAGVGSATLYRHFPTREALLEAAYRDQIGSLVTLAQELPAAAAPLDALVAWLNAFAAYTTTCRGMKELMTAVYDDHSGLSAWCRDTLRSAAAALFGSAQQSGAIRPDVSADQVLRLISAMTLANEQAGAGSAETRQLLSVIIDGLRYQDPAAAAPSSH